MWGDEIVILSQSPGRSQVPLVSRTNISGSRLTPILIAVLLWLDFILISRNCCLGPQDLDCLPFPFSESLLLPFSEPLPAEGRRLPMLYSELCQSTFLWSLNLACYFPWLLPPLGIVSKRVSHLQARSPRMEILNVLF